MEKILFFCLTFLSFISIEVSAQDVYSNLIAHPWKVKAVNVGDEFYFDSIYTTVVYVFKTNGTCYVGSGELGSNVSFELSEDNTRIFFKSSSGTVFQTLNIESLNLNSFVFNVSLTSDLGSTYTYRFLTQAP